jgi:hypothetical protein
MLQVALTLKMAACIDVRTLACECREEKDSGIVVFNYLLKVIEKADKIHPSKWLLLSIH